MAKILVVDDESSLRFAIRLIIHRAGHECLEASNGEQAVRLAARECPDLMVLDVMLPGLNGFEVCEAVRAFDESMGIIMLSAKSDIVDKKTGFRLGADDYLSKPFNDEELLLRIEALLRRRGTGSAERPVVPGAPGVAGILQVGEMVIDVKKRAVAVAGRAVPLTPREFDIMALLASEPGRVFANDEIVHLIWGDEYNVETISIPVYVRRIRKKIEPDPSNPRYLLTAYRMGYLLAVDEP